MRVFIPPELKGLVVELSLQKWVDGRVWPRDRYFGVIDRLRNVLLQVDEEQADNPDALALLLAATLRVDDVYQAYILQTRLLDMGDAETWLKKCLAAAWAIIQKYNREVNNKTWQTDLSDGHRDAP
jgi:hypothetical protein